MGNPIDSQRVATRTIRLAGTHFPRPDITNYESGNKKFVQGVEDG